MNEKLRHTIAIKCKSCETNWSLDIPISGNHVEPFATICDCGALIIGNFNFQRFQSLKNSKNLDEYMKNKIYLTNGHFEILQMQEKEISNLPTLQLE